jgi:hypothetical protein
MKTYLSLFTLLVLACSCSSIRHSRYTKHNEFHYKFYQPAFNFENDVLKIEGAWHWSTHSRAIPKLAWLPASVKQVLRPVAKEHGPVLFATWSPNRTKYSVMGPVPVTKKDVRFRDKNNEPFYIVVLVNDKSFTGDTSKYHPQGRNNDYQFELYTSNPAIMSDDLMMMEVIAATKERYYNYVCILDKRFMPSGKSDDPYTGLMLEDVKTRFFTKD